MLEGNTAGMFYKKNTFLGSDRTCKRNKHDVNLLNPKDSLTFTQSVIAFSTCKSLDIDHEFSRKFRML